MKELSQAYQEYIAAGANPVYAIGLPIAAYLDNLIVELKPKRVLDIGSGFSSYVIRTHPEIDAYSVDEDEQWATFTRDFLRSQQLDAGHVFTSMEFHGLDAGKFDLVLLDAGFEIRRLQLLRASLIRVCDGGTLILDDGQWSQMWRACDVYSKIQQYAFSESRECIDEFGRFPLRINVTHEPKQQPVCVCLAVPRAMVCYDDAFMAFARIFQQGWAIVDLPSCGVAVARDLFAVHLLAHPEFTHTVMLDQDHIHPPDIVHRLAKHVQADRSKWIIGGLHHRRGRPYDAMGYWLDETGHYYTVPREKWGTELREVDAMATASVIFARECFEKFGPTWFGYTYENAQRGMYSSDDICFSRRAQAAGVKMWVDPTIWSPHLQLDGVGPEHFERWLQEHPEEIDKNGEMILDRERG
jgi:hypothetical protein